MKTLTALASITASLLLASTACAASAPAAAKQAAYAWTRATLGGGASWLPYGSSLFHGEATVEVVVFPPRSHALLYDITLRKSAGRWTVVKASHSAQDCYVGSGRVECAGD